MNRSYYIGVPSRRRPISCVFAVVFALSCLGECPAERVRAQASQPSPWFPAEPAWTHAVDAHLAADARADSTRVYIPLDDGHLLALNRETGKVEWSIDLEVTHPVVLHGTSLFAAAGERLYELDGASGRTLQSAPLSGSISAPMILAGDLLAIPVAPDAIIGWHIALRREVWRHEPAGGHGGAPGAASSDTVFVSTADNRVLALRTTDGTVQWARQLAGTLGSPVVVGSRLFVSGNEVVYALDAVDGRVKWHWRGWADIVGVTADRERVYVAALDNIVRALGAGNGNQRWKTVLNTRLLHAPQMIGDMVVVGGLEPAMTVIDSRRGTIRGTYALPELSIVATGPIVLPDRQSDGVMAILFTQAGDVIGLHPQPAKTDKATTDKKPADVSVVTP